MEQKSLTNNKTEDIYQRISTKMDKISDGLGEQSRLLKQIKVQTKENNKYIYIYIYIQTLHLWLP